MNRRNILVALIAFLAALAGVLVGRVAFPAQAETRVDLHALLHEDLRLDADQERQLAIIEDRFVLRRRQLEAQLRADNRRLAAAMQAEHRDGPEACHDGTAAEGNCGPRICNEGAAARRSSAGLR